MAALVRGGQIHGDKKNGGSGGVGASSSAGTKSSRCSGSGMYTDNPCGHTDVTAWGLVGQEWVLLPLHPRPSPSSSSSYHPWRHICEYCVGEAQWVVAAPLWGVSHPLSDMYKGTSAQEQSSRWGGHCSRRAQHGVWVVKLQWPGMLSGEWWTFRDWYVGPRMVEPQGQVCRSAWWKPHKQPLCKHMGPMGIIGGIDSGTPMSDVSNGADTDRVCNCRICSDLT
ncbi:hypothetical protein Tco_0822738 [Tanacetum coccineum]|uniref:Uncharacterized protein n=1 Tax=Tanacetum coccineum TaxID=301880 RepID=A0ABQ5AKV0_9ASTR